MSFWPPHLSALRSSPTNPVWVGDEHLPAGQQDPVRHQLQARTTCCTTSCASTICSWRGFAPTTSSGFCCHSALIDLGEGLLPPHEVWWPLCAMPCWMSKPGQRPTAVGSRECDSLGISKIVCVVQKKFDYRSMKAAIASSCVIHLHFAGVAFIPTRRGAQNLAVRGRLLPCVGLRLVNSLYGRDLQRCGSPCRGSRCARIYPTRVTQEARAEKMPRKTLESRNMSRELFRESFRHDGALA